MTETTSIQFMRERRAYAPVVQQPGLATFIAQAAVGSFCGGFVVLIARILLVYSPRNGFYVFYLPFLMALGVVTGVLAGLLIWAGTREADGPLLGITRALLGVLVTGMTWFGIWYFWLRGEAMSSETQLWMLAGVVVSGVSIGIATGSRLRPWRELVRGGETKATALKILAGLIGLVLRSVVVLLFIASIVLAITIIQVYFLGPQPPFNDERTAMVWSLLLFGHFALGMVVLFARMKFWSLVVLAVISTAPVAASLGLVMMQPPEQYFVIGYLSLWVLFLLTRWRQADVAVAALKEELRYYLIVD